jgi:ATP-binding cassette subfamily B protein
MDRSAMWLTALVPRGWLLLGLLALAPAFALTSTSPGQLAVGLGGVLLALRALQRLTAGLSNLAGASIAWKHISTLLRAAERPLESRPLHSAHLSGGQQDSPKREQPLLEAHDLNFCYRARGIPVLRECSLRIHHGDRIILEGPSGGGKSTLAAMLTGLRLPDSGLLLLDGLDRQTVGLNGWRRQVAAAPQFHENHVLTGTFAFNVLMGSGWPPRPEAFEKAETICRELGLQDLLQRMPAGLLQSVGESGWQLSQGERSRLFIARALLQGAELIVLDESFASLDPENLTRALRCVLDRAKTLLVIAHP